MLLLCIYQNLFYLSVCMSGWLSSHTAIWLASCTKTHYWNVLMSWSSMNQLLLSNIVVMLFFQCRVCFNNRAPEDATKANSWSIIRQTESKMEVVCIRLMVFNWLPRIPPIISFPNNLSQRNSSQQRPARLADVPLPQWSQTSLSPVSALQVCKKKRFASVFKSSKFKT